jgi:hypothetical protein
VVCKRCASTTSSPSTATTSTSASLSSSTAPISSVLTGVRLSSERGNGQLLDGWNVEVCCCLGWWRGCVVE